MVEDLIALASSDLTRQPDKRLIDAVRQTEEVIRSGHVWSGKLIAELYRRGHTWSQLVALTGIAQTTLWNRSRPYR